MSHVDATPTAVVRQHILMRAGRAVARDWSDEAFAEPSLCGLAERLDPSLRGRSPVELSRAFIASDLGLGIASAIEHIASAIAAGGDQHRQLVRQLPVKSFRSTGIPSLSIGDLITMPEGGIWPATPITGSSALESVAIEGHALRLLISRETLVNDDVGALDAVAVGLGAAAQRAELSAIAAALEASDTLADGLAFFNTTSGNLYSSAAVPSLTTLNVAVPMLRKMALADGAPSCAVPKYIVVPPALEYTARVLATAAGADALAPELSLEVIVLPHLASDTTWYLLADPSVTPALGLLGIGDALPLRTVTVERAPRKATEDGLSLFARNEFRIARLSRYGAVKVTY